MIRIGVPLIPSAVPFEMHPGVPSGVSLFYIRLGVPLFDIRFKVPSRILTGFSSEFNREFQIF